nr:MAG TPA: hypothetical protein [Caudoviricetes sp.]
MPISLQGGPCKAFGISTYITFLNSLVWRSRIQ